MRILGILMFISCFFTISVVEAQYSPLSVGAVVELPSGIPMAGLRMAYNASAQFKVFGEVRYRAIEFNELGTDCIVIDPKKYSQLAFLDPERERIAMSLDVSGSAPFALGIIVTGKKRIAPFLTLRGEVVQYKFNLKTFQQTSTAPSSDGRPAYWSTGSSVASLPQAGRRIGGSLQTGLSFTGKKGWMTYHFYMTADQYSVKEITINATIAGYRDVEPAAIWLGDHYDRQRFGFGIAASVNLGQRRE